MNKIIIISGDPNSINSEIIYRSLKKIKSKVKKKIYLVSNLDLLNSQLKKMKMNLNFQVVKNLNENVKSNKIKVINVNLKFSNSFNVQKKQASNFVLKSLNLAHKLATSEKAVGIINCPIDKTLLNKEKIGVTEYLSKKSKIKKDSEAMLISGPKLSVCPITTHIDIRDVPNKLNKRKIIEKIVTIEKWFRLKFKRTPRFGILGLNPHNAELRKNSEERKVIIPAIIKLK